MINIIENYISLDTANFLCKVIGPTTVETPDKSVWGGPSKIQDGDDLKLGNPISPYTQNAEYNVALDILTMLATSMSKTISDHYNLQYVPKSIFYSKMTEGAKNSLHMDNLYLSSDTDTLTDRPFSNGDKSGLLYLNSDYEGAELHFPLDNLKFKPKPGTFIFFEGNEENPHEVLPMLSGERHNIISFYWDKLKSGSGASLKVGYNGLPEKQLTAEYLHSL